MGYNKTREDSEAYAVWRCPFCASDATALHSNARTKLCGRVRYWISCETCDATGPITGSGKTAVRRWNELNGLSKWERKIRHAGI